MPDPSRAAADPGRRVLAFAHRGGAAHPDLVGLENTMLAFRHAADLGYTHLETDVHATRDGVLVALHDEVLDRVTDGRGRVAEATYAELLRARVDGREPVPTFAELLRAFPRAAFNVDLKSPRAGTLLADLLDAEDAHDRVLVGSFSVRRTAAFRRRTRGRVATAATPPEVACFRLLPARVARLLTRGRVAALQVPHRRGPVRVVTPGLVRRAHAVGVPVHVWVVDDPAEMRELLELGVDGLMTDRTDLLRTVLLEHGLWAAGTGTDRRAAG